MLFRSRDDLDLVTPFVVTNVDCAFLDIEYPKGEDAVENCVKCNSNRGVEFRIVEAEFEVPVEGCGTYCECCVA